MPTQSDFVIDKGDTAWMMVCSTFVFLMAPALGFFYAGLARAKNALSLMYLTVLSVAVVSLQWYLIGYSLTFSETGGRFVGDSAHFLLRDVGLKPQLEGQTIPASVFMIFQAMFACITPALAFGSAAERMSLGPSILFIFLWTTACYDIITCWVWGPNGWLFKLGTMDYAGGTPVHISSGLAAVAYAMVLGKRRDYHENVNTPHNVSFVFLGLALMWFGWFCFNAGSALAANARSVHSLVCTHLSGCVGALVWVLMDYHHTRKWSIIGLCTGAVAGLATITPGSGFVSTSSSLAFGALGSIVCNIAVRYKHKLRFDDALDVFAVHYIGGLVGLFLTGVFAQRSVIALSYPEDTPLDQIQLGGWLDGNWMQVPVQLAAIASVSAYSFVVTYIILVILNKIPWCRLRLDDEAELIGTDWAEMGERAYAYLPMEEEEKQQNRSSTSSCDDDELVVETSSSTTATSHPTKHRALRGIKKFLQPNSHQHNRRHPLVVTGMPDLIEEPVVLDYTQQKDLGAIHLTEITEPTSGNLFQKTPAQIREEQPLEVEGQPMKAQQQHHHANSSSSSSSSNNSHSGRA